VRGDRSVPEMRLVTVLLVVVPIMHVSREHRWVSAAHDSEELRCSHLVCEQLPTCSRAGASLAGIGRLVLTVFMQMLYLDNQRR
jgi:hypothetical protein